MRDNANHPVSDFGVRPVRRAFGVGSGGRIVWKMVTLTMWSHRWTLTTPLERANDDDRRPSIASSRPVGRGRGRGRGCSLWYFLLHRD